VTDWFDTYSPPDGGSVPLVGLGGWVDAEANGAAGGPGVIVHDDWGMENTDGVYLSAPNYVHVGLNVGTLTEGDQVRVLFQVPSASNWAELWVGDARHVDGIPNNEVTMHVEMGGGPSNFIYYHLITDSPTRTGIYGIYIDSLNHVGGYLGHSVEIRMTMTKSDTETSGLDGAIVEVRNITRISQGIVEPNWVYIGQFPVNSQGIGYDDIYVVLGGQGVVFDDFNVIPALPGPEDFDSYNEGEDLICQGNWFLPDALGGGGAASNTDMKVVAGAGIDGTNAFVVGPTYSEHAGLHIGELYPGDQASVAFQIPEASSYADIRIGERMADFGPSGSALTMEMGSGAGDNYYYSLSSHPIMPGYGPNNITLPDDSAGKLGDWAEVRMTMTHFPGEITWGIDSATVEARNLTTGSDWQYIGELPLNANGIGNGFITNQNMITTPSHAISVVLCGRGVSFDNLNVTAMTLPPAPGARFCGDVGTEYLPGDVSGPEGTADCYVDFYDIGFMASEWLECTDPTDPQCDLAAGAGIILSGDVPTIDGLLDDWPDPDWMSLDNIYAGGPTHDVAEAKFAARWNATTDKIYAVVVVDDAEMIFADEPGSSISSDRIEVYSQGDAAGGTGWGAHPADTKYFDIAQHYMIGSKVDEVTHWACFATEGVDVNYDVGAGFAELEHAVVVDDLNGRIIYEIGVQQYDNYGGESGGDTIVTALEVGHVVGFDIIATSRHNTAPNYTMLAENTMVTKYRDAGQFQQYVLSGGADVCGDWGYKRSDVNKDCIVSLEDFADLASNWMYCSDPAESTCDQYWRP